MPPLRHRFSVAILLVWASAGTARAQSAATCSFDPGTATLTVNVNGISARLLAAKSSGEIRLDGGACGGATVTNTDSIQVNGGALSDELTLNGNFAPGLTAEADASSEIEILFALGGGSDYVNVNLSSASNKLFLTAGGLDVGNDGDEDITTAGTEFLTIDGGGGHDTINASAYSGTGAGGRLDLYGGPGNDQLTGDALNNRIWGDDGNDILYGLAGNDRLYGGPGDDRLYGGEGNDWFFADATVDGSDVMRGGPGADNADYHYRSVAVNLTLGNSLADDGEAGEGDSIELDVENASGGNGDDVLVGSPRGNWLRGWGGNDEVYGGLGDDGVDGGEGNDHVDGEAGNDSVSGWYGDDILIGGDGVDYFEGNSGNDTIYNADAFADTVSCGDGGDTVEDDPLDTFLLDCEL